MQILPAKTAQKAPNIISFRN